VSGLVNLAEATVVKGRTAFCLAQRDGSLPLDGDHPLGLYREDCRHLCGHELRLGGEPLRLLVADDVAATALVCELTNNDTVLDGGGLLPMQHLRARVERRDRASVRAGLDRRAHRPVAADCAEDCTVDGGSTRTRVGRLRPRSIRAASPA
jgi:hypothetical protein